MKTIRRMFRKIQNKYAFLLFLGSVLILANCTSSRKKTPKPGNIDQLNFQVSTAVTQSDYFGVWDSIMPKAGSIAPDFTIYSLEGEQFNLYDQIKKERAILLINGSYTCDLSRRALPKIKELYKKYSTQIDIYIIYTAEAHPKNHISPYSRENKIWVRSENIRDGIEAEKPTTYGERKKLSRQWKNRFEIQPKILIDNPDNIYWNLYGQAPNMAYLIGEDGRVIERQINFHLGKIEKAIKRFLQVQKS